MCPEEYYENCIRSSIGMIDSICELIASFISLPSYCGTTSLPSLKMGYQICFDNRPNIINCFQKSGIFIGMAFLDDKVYASDYKNNEIVVYKKSPVEFLFSFGKSGTEDSELNCPYYLSIHKRMVFVADKDNNRIQVFDEFGGHKFYFRNKHLKHPRGIYCNKNKVFVTDDNYLNIFDENGIHLKRWNFIFKFPMGIFVSKNLVYVCDYINCKIRIFSAAGELLDSLGSHYTEKFGFPLSICFNNDRHILALVCETKGNNYKLIKFKI